LFPTSRFRMVFDVLQEKLGRPKGSKEYLKILELAAKESEVQVDEALRALLEGGIEEISANRIETMLSFHRGDTTRDVQVVAIDLGIFDELCEVREVLQ
jgi:hypothetical protein